MATPNDTTTTLNTGSGGDVMDESLVTQSNGVTMAKRPRVVIGGDASGDALIDPVLEGPDDPVYSLPTLSSAVVSDARPGGYVSGEVRPLSMTSDGRIRVSSSEANTQMDFFGDAAPLSTDVRGFFDVNNNPWGL